jgi:o-succinylbenzoate synthase
VAIVRLSKISLFSYRIPLIFPHISSVGSVTEREGIILRGETEDGRVGLGEAAPYPGRSEETIADVRNHALSIKKHLTEMLVPSELEELESHLKRINVAGQLPPSLNFGVETMLADLASQQSAQSLSRWLNAEATDSVALNALLPTNVSSWSDFVAEKRKRGYSAFKMKVAHRSLSDDIDAVRELSSLLLRDETMRLDANRGFEYDDATVFVTSISDAPIAYIEEPLVSEDVDRLPDLKAETGVKIAIDESVSDDALLSRLLDSGSVKAVVLKPTILGGISHCLKLAEKAYSHGANVVVTSVIESGIGIMAALHLAAILGGKILPCGLDTLDYLAESLPSNPPIVGGGRMLIPDLSGLGMELSDSAYVHMKEISS